MVFQKAPFSPKNNNSNDASTAAKTKNEKLSNRSTTIGHCDSSGPNASIINNNVNPPSSVAAASSVATTTNTTPSTGRLKSMTMIAAVLIVHCLLLQSVQSRSNRYTSAALTTKGNSKGTDVDRQRDFDFDAVERRQNRELLQQFTKETNLEPTHDDETKNKFYEVDAHGDDYVDFGALTGQNGAFSWHANFPLE